MTVRAALVLGVCIVLAALVHGGVYAPGRDFIVNRFTGRFEFVPSDEERWDEEGEVSGALCRALTARVPPDRFDALHHRR